MNKLSKMLSKLLNHGNTQHRNEDIHRLRIDTKSKENIKIHLGCGPRVLKGWINIDLAFEPYEKYLKYYTNKFYGKKIRGDINDFYAINIVKQPLPIESGSVSVVFHEDFIEHLDQKEQFLLLAEVLRILKKGGVHRINTPDIINTMKANSKFEDGFTGIYQKEWDKHVHKNILSEISLTEMARTIGYSKVIMQKRNLSVANIPKEYRPDPKDRPENGNLYMDLIK